MGDNVTATCCRRRSNQAYTWCYPRVDVCGSLESRGLSRMQDIEWNGTTSCEMGSFKADQRAVLRCKGIGDKSNLATLEVTDGGEWFKWLYTLPWWLYSRLSTYFPCDFIVPKEFTISHVNVTGAGYSGATLTVAARIQFSVSFLWHLHDVCGYMCMYMMWHVLS